MADKTVALSSDYDGWKSYTNKLVGLSLRYPPTWAFEEDPSIGIVVLAEASMLAHPEQNPLAPVVNIIAHRTPGATDLETVTKIQKQRLMDMTGNPELKLDKETRLGGHPAHKVTSLVPLDHPTHQTMIKFYSCWTLVDDTVYSVVFNCLQQAYPSLSKIVSKMLASLVITKPKPRSITLGVYKNTDNLFSFKYPITWSKQVHEEGFGPLAHYVFNTKKDDKHFVAEAKVVVQEGDNIEDHIETLRDNLSAMDVKSIEVEKTSVGAVPARIIVWDSDAASGVHTHYTQIVAKTPGINKMVVLTASTDLSTEEETIHAALDVIVRSLRFHNDDTVTEAEKSMHSLHHLVYSFNLSFDPTHYALKDESLPFTEAAFTLKGEDPENPTTTLSVICRKYTPDKPINLREVIDEIKENLEKICGPSLRIEENSQGKQDGRSTRTIKMRGLTPVASDPHEKREMCFAHKVINDEARCIAVMFAFTCYPSFFKKEWPICESYVQTLKWL